MQWETIEGLKNGLEEKVALRDYSIVIVSAVKSRVAK